MADPIEIGKRPAPLALDRKVTIAGAGTAESKRFTNTECSLRQLGEGLARCKFSSVKDGPCFLPGALTGDGQRGNDKMASIELLPYDLDTGHPIERTLLFLSVLGIEAWVYTTYHHEKPETIVPGGRVERWAKLPKNTAASVEQVLDYLSSEKGYAPHVLQGAGMRRADKGFDWIVRHKPMGRYRLVIPLSRPLLMTELGNTPDAAVRAYKGLYAAVAGAHGIEHYDRSCQDPAHASYAHRRPEGAQPFFQRLEGKLLDPDRFIAGAREAAAAAAPAKQDAEYKTPDLAHWFLQRGDGFRAADFLATFGVDAKSNSNGGVEAVCPLQDQHSDGGDGRRTCYAYNAATSQNGHPAIGCNHDSCRLKGPVFVDALLQQHERGVEALNDYTDTPAPDTSPPAVLKSMELEPTAPKKAELAAAVSHDKLALQFSTQHADSLKFVATWRKWLEWDGSRWRQDDTLHTRHLVRDAVRKEAAKQEKSTTANTIESKWTVWAVELMAQCDRRHAATVDMWDRDPWLLGTPSGTVDLRTGELRPAMREDMITKTTAVAPAGECPRWLNFLDTVFAGDRELTEYMQRVLGYSLIGDVSEHALVFCYGVGGNGKSTLLNTWQGIVGDYGVAAPKGMLEESKHERHPTEIARLRGARVVTAQETERGSRWAETYVKGLTGGDRLTGRFMRGDFFEFEPQHLLIVAGNHKPDLRDVTDAMRRRLHLVPFTIHFADGVNRVLGMEERLKAEWPGILRWGIEGAVMWRQVGLGKPRAVRDATAAYFNEQDVIEGFLAECCALDDLEASEGASDLFNRFSVWVVDKGKTPLSQKAFSARLQTRLSHKRQNKGVIFKGVRLLPLPPNFFG